MPDPQTTNLQLFTPANGADFGIWDQPVNANWTQLDSCLGAVATVTLSNVPVTLSAGQYNTRMIIFTGTLTASVNVTFPAFGRNWLVWNKCVSNTAFNVVCGSTTTTQTACAPPGEPTMIMSDGSGTSIQHMGLGRVGSYLDMGSSSVPLWITGSTPAPYLNCDGTSFSSATYPVLRDYLGGNTLPDSKGRFRAALNQGSGRLTGGVNGNNLLAVGGNQAIAVGNIPNYSLPVSDPGHTHPVSDPGHTHVTNNYVTPDLGTPYNITGGGGQFFFGSLSGTVASVTNINLFAAGTGITVASGGSGAGYAPPVYMGGLTLIRAA